MSERPISPLDEDTVRDGSSAPRTARKVRERYLGPYRLLRHIGGGGMGVVYQAEDPRLGRTVALKLLPPELTRDPRAKARFLQEARAASALDHPNICSIYEVGETDDLQIYLAMPCYDGETLRDRIERGPLPIAEAVDIAGQVAQGLAKAHQKGIVHRDIKPANLMITADGLVKILDFGTAKLVGSAGLTRTGSVIGTPAYMSPEQMNGDEVDERTDLWSLGVVIYEMVTGKRPFRGDHEAALREAILRTTPAPLGQDRPDAPAALDRLATSLLSKNPAARPASAEAVMRTLGSVSREPSASDRSGVWRFRIAAGLLLPILALIVIPSPSRRQSTLTPLPPSQLSQAAGLAPAAISHSERRPSVVVLGFRDLSGESSTRGWLGPALTEMLTSELAAGAKVRVMASERAVLTRNSLELASTASPSQATLESLKVLTGTELAVIGMFLPLEEKGSRTLRLDVRVLTLPEGETVASVAEVGPESHLFSVVERVGEKLRNALGISMPSEEQSWEARHLLPTDSAAIHLYTEALVYLRAYEPGKARDLLLHAMRLDPSSPMTHSALSESWTLLGFDAHARKAALQAYELRQTLPKEMQLVLEARLYMVERQWSRASEIYRSLWTLFPDETEYGLQLASALMMEGRGPEGIAILKELRERLSPEAEDPRVDLVTALTASRIADFSLQERAAAAVAVKAQRIKAPLLLVQGLTSQSNALLQMGRVQEALVLAEQAERLASREGERWFTGMALAQISWAKYALGQWHEAKQAHERSLEIARDIGTEIGIGWELFFLGTLHRDQGNLMLASNLLEQAWESTRKRNDQRLRGRIYSETAPVVLALGDPGGAKSLLKEALSVAHLVKNRKDEAWALYRLAELHDFSGDLKQAIRLEEEVLHILRDLNEPKVAALVLASSADLLRRHGNLPLARRRLVQAFAMGRKSTNVLVTGQLLEMRARFACETGNLTLCRSSSQAALDVARQLGARPLEAAALRQQARASEMSGDLASARRLILESLRLSTDMGDQLATAATRVDLARLDLKQGDRASAERLARESAKWYRERNLRGGEAAALAVLTSPAHSDPTVTEP